MGSQSAMQSASEFIKKYFFVQQVVHKSKTNTNTTGTNEKLSFLERNKKVFSILIPFLVVQLIWWPYMISQDKFYIFNETIGKHKQPIYLLTVTMIFGSMIAGSTSEGGAAVAFPVLTLLFGVLPSVARDFSYMIQSVGMTCAAFTIIYMGVRLEYQSLLWCTIGGTVGVIFGLEFVSTRLSPAYTKMYFVWIWFSFAIALFWLNFYHDRKVYHGIPYWAQGNLRYSDLPRIRSYLAGVVMRSLRSVPIVGEYVSLPSTEHESPDAGTGRSNGDGSGAEMEQAGEERETSRGECDAESGLELRACASSEGKQHVSSAMAAAEPEPEDFITLFGFPVNWKALVLLAGGFLGGVFSAMGGSGLDICSFSLLTLLFCVSERIATPTSVVLMAINTVVAFFWRWFYNDAIATVCWDMWLGCIPVVVVGAPLGAILSSHWHRLVIAMLVVSIDVAQLIGALYVVRPWTTLKTNNPSALMTKSLVLFAVAGILFTLLALGGNDLLRFNTNSTLISPKVREEEERLHAEVHEEEGEEKEGQIGIIDESVSEALKRSMQDTPADTPEAKAGLEMAPRTAAGAEIEVLNL